MAQIPAIQPSSRTLVNLPQTYVAHGYEPNTGREVSRLVNTAGRVAEHIFYSVQRGNERRRLYDERQQELANREARHQQAYADRASTQEADLALAEWETAMRRGVNGWSDTDKDGNPVVHKGIAQKSWTDYERTKTSPISDLAEIEKTYQTENERYRNLSPAAKEKFDAKATGRRQSFFEQVNRIYDHNFAQKRMYEKQVMDKNDIERVELSIYADDNTFADTAADAAVRMTIREMEPLIENMNLVNSPDFSLAKVGDLRFKNGKQGEDIFATAVKERLFGDKGFALGRITYLTQHAAAGETVNGLSPQDALAKADQWIDYLGKLPEATYKPTEKETVALKSIVNKARGNYSRLMETATTKWAQETETDLLSRLALPEEGNARDNARYHAQRSAAYRQILESENGKRLAKYAPVKFRAFQNMIVAEANSAVSATRKDNGSRLLALIDDGYINGHEITAAEVQATADQLMAEKLITQADYDKAKRAKAKVLSPAAKALHEKIFANKGAKFPEMMKWQENLGAFIIPESKAGTKAANTKLSLVKEAHWYGDDKETLLFKEYVKAANYAIQYLEAKNCTVDQAFAEFQALTLNTEKELATLAYDERLKRKEEALSALRRRTVNHNISFAKEVVK